MGELAKNYQLQNPFLRKVSLFRWYMTMVSNMASYQQKVIHQIELSYKDGVTWIQANVPEEQKETRLTAWLATRIKCLEQLDDSSDIIQTICDACYHYGVASTDAKNLLLQCLDGLRTPSLPTL